MTGRDVKAAAPKFEVAISFKKEDEPFALQIKAALDPPLSTFVYSKAQEHLAGRDGLEAFSEVFKNDCRLMVVLFREGWGETPWTRAEATAIKTRCVFGDGWTHFLLVRLDDSTLPSWVPPLPLYFDPGSFPLEQLIGAIRARCGELGSVLRGPSAVELAAAQHAQELFDRETRQILENGPGAFRGAFGDVCRVLESRAQAIAEATGRLLKTGHGDYGSFVVRDEGLSLAITPDELYANTARDAVLRAQLFRGQVILQEERSRGMGYIQHPKPVGTKTLKILRVAELGWCWKLESRHYPPEDVADELLKWMIEHRVRNHT